MNDSDKSEGPRTEVLFGGWLTELHVLALRPRAMILRAPDSGACVEININYIT